MFAAKRTRNAFVSFLLLLELEQMRPKCQTHKHRLTRTTGEERMVGALMQAATPKPHERMQWGCKSHSNTKHTHWARGSSSKLITSGAKDDDEDNASAGGERTVVGDCHGLDSHCGKLLSVWAARMSCCIRWKRWVGQMLSRVKWCQTHSMCKIQGIAVYILNTKRVRNTTRSIDFPSEEINKSK